VVGEGERGGGGGGRGVDRHRRRVTLHVDHLLSQEKYSLLLQGGLDLGKANQRSRHFQLGGNPRDSVAGYLVSLLAEPVAAPLQLVSRPTLYMRY